MNTYSTQTHRTLKNAMADYGISLRRLAMYIGCSPSLLSMMMSGQRKFKLKYKDRIISILKIEDNIEWINQ